MRSTMHHECLPPKGREVLKRLAPLIRENAFILGGGTALALQMGHRLSVDLDFFSQKSFSTESLLQHLKRLRFMPHVLQEEEGTLTIIVDDVKVSFFHYPYPFLVKCHTMGGIPVADRLDIASMKVIAITQRGAKRDFVDLYWVLQELPFWKVAQNMIRRFGSERINPLHVGKSLVFFADAEADPEPQYIAKKMPRWNDIKAFFVSNVQQMVLDLQRAKTIANP